MTGGTVRQRLANVNRVYRTIVDTACAACGHAYVDHGPYQRCWHPRVRLKAGEQHCRCKTFVDPAGDEPPEST